MVKSIPIVLFLLLFNSPVFSALPVWESGTPFITNYSPKEYQANGQNWSAVQDSNGLLYFANSDGAVLQYDGVRWITIPAGNGSIVRDIRLDKSGRIFAGMQNEFGYIQLNDSGRYVYRSLLNKVNCIDDKFGDIWKIVVTEKSVYFLERHHLFRFSKKHLRDSLYTAKTIKAQTRFHNLFNVHNNRLFVQQINIGLMETDADSLRLVLNGAFFKNDLIAAVLPFSESNWLVVTRSRGIFIYSENGRIKPFKTNCDKLLRENHLYQAIRLSDGNLAIASKYGGLFILSSSGQLLQKIDESTGLANNTVWSVLEDSRRGLWLALNNGIAFVDYASPFSQFDKQNGLKGSVHDLIRYRGKIYVTSNFGLFVSVSDKSIPGRIHFKQVPGISTSGWDMFSAHDMLFISVNSGIYKLDKGRARLLFKYDPWEFCQSKWEPRRIYIGLAFGVASFYISADGRLIDEGKIPGIDIETRTLAEDSLGRLWTASSYHGVQRADSMARYFKNNIPPVVTTYNEQNGLPSNMFTHVFESKAKIQFSTPKGIYSYDARRNRFSLNPAFKELNKKKQGDETYMLAQTDSSGNVWSNIGSKIVLSHLSSTGKYYLIDTLFWGIPEEDIQCIYPENERSVWFGQRNRIIKYDSKKQNSIRADFKTLIRSVLLNNKTYLPGTQSMRYIKNISELQYSAGNMLRFSFAAPFFIQPKKTVYRYRLVNFDRNWSDWSSETQKDYTNLPQGKYTFKVESRNIYGKTGKAAFYSFRILAPWYQTGWAWLLFLLLFIGLVYILSRYLISYSQSKALAEHQRIEEQRRKTEEAVRSQVAADFHDELGTRITRISLFSEILKSDLGEMTESAENYLGKISKNADRLYDETRDFIWQLDPKKDSLPDLIARIKSFGDELFEDTEIQFEVIQDLQNLSTVKLEMDQRRNLIRIIKEALHNALKYAQCKNIIFKVSRQRNQIHFMVRDDGVGFSKENESDGIGLRNMQQRAQIIMAELQIKSQPGKGTQIELSIGI